MTNNDPFSPKDDKNFATSSTGSASSAGISSSTVRPEGVTGRTPSAFDADDADIVRGSRPEDGSGRRYSFNMLLATAVAGYAIGRLLPR